MPVVAIFKSGIDVSSSFIEKILLTFVKMIGREAIHSQTCPFLSTYEYIIKRDHETVGVDFLGRTDINVLVLAGWKCGEYDVNCHRTLFEDYLEGSRR